MSDNVVQRKSFEFALVVVALYKRLAECREFVLSKQLLRTGTSIGANVEEALSGQSKRDFAAKMAIALKEARESRYWLRLLRESDLANVDVSQELDRIEELIRILAQLPYFRYHDPAISIVCGIV